VGQSRELALSQSVLELAGVRVALCYQCGKCSASCPMAKFMDLLPNQVMPLVQFGDTPAVPSPRGCSR